LATNIFLKILCSILNRRRTHLIVERKAERNCPVRAILRKLTQIYAYIRRYIQLLIVVVSPQLNRAPSFVSKFNFHSFPVNSVLDPQALCFFLSNFISRNEQKHHFLPLIRFKKFVTKKLLLLHILSLHTHVYFVCA
jgi:hypothetical protein